MIQSYPLSIFSPAAVTMLTFVFITGIITGSFLNVCIYRIPLEKTVIKGRSYCPSCQKLIPWYLNIPLLSYMALGGKCRYCKTGISPVYPAVELLTGILWLVSFLFYGLGPSALLLSLFFSLLVVIAFIDMRHRIIPDGLVIAALVLGGFHAAFRVYFFHDNWHLYAIGFFAASLPLLILGLIYPDGMGGGDIKFMAAAGLFAGWKLILLSLFLGSLVALLYVIVQLLRRIPLRGIPIPFAPFLSAGIVLSLLFGSRIIAFYLKYALGF